MHIRLEHDEKGIRAAFAEKFLMPWTLLRRNIRILRPFRNM